MAIHIAFLLSITSQMRRIWRKESDVAVEHLLSSLAVIPIAPCRLAFGRMGDMEEAITCHREALAL